MPAANEQSIRKSFYIFLTALLGVLLFVVLDRLLVFGYLLLAGSNYAVFGLNLSYVEFWALDYLSLFFVMMAGAWYGIWVGLYWYARVYEDRTHQGFVHHVATRYWPFEKRARQLQSQVRQVEKQLENDLHQLSDLADELPAVKAPPPVKRPMAKKRTPRKLKTKQLSAV